MPLLALLFLLCLPLPSAHAESWRFSEVDRIVAVGDIHGAYDALIATLQKANVIDDNLAWSGGKAHLVSTGDLLDRGADSRRVMDLVMRLEAEAVSAGGRVHLVLGNHEVMNLTGDLRYVADAEFAAFAGDESAVEREQRYQRFRRRYPADADELTISSEFNEQAPPGFFGHRAAFRQDGVYGKWLLEKPLLIVVNDTAFVHGGMPPYVAEEGFTGVNGTLKSDLLSYLVARSTLESEDILSPVDRFKQLPSILLPIIDAGQLDDALLKAAQVVLEHKDSRLHNPTGPTWYRGTASCSGLIESDSLNVALSKVGAARVVLGHTTTVTRHVQQRMDGRVVEIDTGMLKENYGGSGNALIIEGAELTVVNQDGTANLAPIAHPVRVGHESIAITDDELANILATGSIVGSTTDRVAWRLVQVTADDKTVSAYFSELPRKKGFLPELAAYRLDRMLGLGMVPVTVRREIDGQEGILQFVPAQSSTERARVAAGVWRGAPCSRDKQMGAMHIFDALIDNPARTPSSMLYSPDDWLLMLVEHEHSFSAAKGRPAYLKGVELAIGDQWRTALRELDDEALREELGDVLDKRRIRALAKRRDALIKYSGR